jgi:hypothetical protein
MLKKCSASSSRHNRSAGAAAGASGGVVAAAQVELRMAYGIQLLFKPTPLRYVTLGIYVKREKVGRAHYVQLFEQSSIDAILFGSAKSAVKLVF